VAAAERNTRVHHAAAPPQHNHASFQSGAAASPESAEYQFRYGSARANAAVRMEAHETAAVVGAAAAAHAESLWATEVGQTGQTHGAAEPVPWQNT